MVEQLTAVTTTSLTFIAMPNTSHTPGAGRYLVLLSAQMRSIPGAPAGSPHTHDHLAVGIFIDGNLVAGSERIIDVKKWHQEAIFTQTIVTLTAGQTLSGRWRTLDGGEKEVSARSLVVLKLVQ